ncbi:Fic family protein [Prosthecobacter sp.]|uniref:Fic family protein n=1 Tax=Prosthecobacter sp. TaxID=1965333 RepID=UPI0037851ED0
MRPPFEVTPRSARLLAEIERLLGRHEGAQMAPASPMLRRSMRVRTIQASLQIEGNTLSEEQVTALLEGRRVLAPARDLLEVKNAIACYEKLPKWRPGSAKHLLAAHKVMMAGLVPRAGAWRSKGVGIAKGNVIAHVAPPAARVPGLMQDLLDWVDADDETPALIRAAVCHYEMEFIHPFEDGNGRMGRLWHSLILQQHHPLFAQAPVESAIRDRQADYYAVLDRCDKAGKSTAFIEFALELTLHVLQQAGTSQRTRMSSEERMTEARRHFGKRIFSRKDYLQHFTGLSSASASRDLREAASKDVLTRTGDKALTRYRFGLTIAGASK